MNPENLMPPPVKGEIRNPKGRGHVKGRKTVLREALKHVVDSTAETLPALTKQFGEELKGKNTEEIMAMAIVFQAMKGDTTAYKEIQDTMHSKLTEKVTHAGDRENPVVIERAGVPALMDGIAAEIENLRAKSTLSLSSED